MSPKIAVSDEVATNFVAKAKRNKRKNSDDSPILDKKRRYLGHEWPSLRGENWVKLSGVNSRVSPHRKSFFGMRGSRNSRPKMQKRTSQTRNIPPRAEGAKRPARDNGKNSANETWMRQRSNISRLCIHFTWCVKYRQKILTNRMAVEIRNVIHAVAREFDLRIVAFEAESDHVHLVLWYPPNVSPSTIMRRIKGASARAIGKTPEWTRLTRFPTSKNVWAPSFSASSCEGASVKRLKRYVDRQAPRMTEEQIIAENAKRRIEKKAARSIPTNEFEGIGPPTQPGGGSS